MEPIQATVGKGMVRPGQIASPSQSRTRTVTANGQFRATNQPEKHAFRQWEEDGVPAENICVHGEDIQTPHRKEHNSL